MGLVPLWHVGSSWTRDRTRVPCIDRWIPNHCATRQVPQNICLLLNYISWDSEGVIFSDGLKSLSLAQEKVYRVRREDIESNTEEQ